jgi:hypothetical protein
MATPLQICSDPKTQLCPKDTKIFHAAKSGNFTLCVCSLIWNSDYSGPGFVEWDSTETAAFTSPTSTTPLKSLWFRCGNKGQVVGQFQPSWEVETIIGYDEFIPGGAQSVADKWQVGFIQTVESLEWEALYADGWGRKTIVGRCRDAATDSVTAPWFADPGSKAKGAPFPLSDAGNNHPMLADEPKAKFSVAHPDDDGWCKQITEVNVKGKFHLWLVAWDTRQPLGVPTLVFLYYSAIDLDKKWVLSGSDPFDLIKWTATGKQTRSAVTNGQGSVAPVLTTPVANTSLLTFATHKKGTKCPRKTGGPIKTQTDED